MLLQTLKDETRAEHVRSEQSLSLPHRLASPRAYGHLLAHFWGFYAPLEDRLATYDDWRRYGISIQQRSKAHLALADLQALGWTPEAIAALPRCQVLPALADFSQAFGGLYVLEGSTLGGQYIAGQVKQALGLTPERGCCFFTSYGEQVGPMWRAFRAALERAERAGLDAAAVVFGARETFRAFDSWLASSEECA